MSENTTNGNIQIANHELLIRVDSDVKHMSQSLNEMRERQSMYEKNNIALTENLTKLTYNVGAIVEGMKEVKENMRVISEHAVKITTLEEKCYEQDSDIKTLKTDVDHLNTVNIKGKFLWKIVWGVITTPIAISILYAIFKLLKP